VPHVERRPRYIRSSNFHFRIEPVSPPYIFGYMHFPAWRIAPVTDVTNNTNAIPICSFVVYVSVTAYAERFCSNAVCSHGIGCADMQRSGRLFGLTQTFRPTSHLCFAR